MTLHPLTGTPREAIRVSAHLLGLVERSGALNVLRRESGVRPSVEVEPGLWRVALRIRGRNVVAWLHQDKDGWILSHDRPGVTLPLNPGETP